jgi:hypothetical protein
MLVAAEARKLGHNYIVEHLFMRPRGRTADRNLLRRAGLDPRHVRARNPKEIGIKVQVAQYC